MHYIVKGKKIKEFNKVRRRMDGFPFMYIISVADLGEGPEPSLHPSPPPPQLSNKLFFGYRASPLSQGLCDRAPSFS